ncbi:MAG: reverse transcriptase domain-containing protein [Planctomycetaceae bacterium]
MCSFEIRDPKCRLISAAPYADRVVQQALCCVIEPLFERSFIFDSWACRPGKGQHLAIQRARQMLRKFPWVLKTDIRRYFPSIDHDLLMQRLARTIGDRSTLELLETIIRHPWPGQQHCRIFPGDDLFTPLERTCGLPIGNLTSQLCGNLYLDETDHWLQQSLRIPGYLRYMDDLVIFGPDKQFVIDVLARLRHRMQTLRLQLHPTKTQIHPSRCGLRFLGYHITTQSLHPVPETVTRFRRKLRSLQKLYSLQQLTLPQLQQITASYWGHFLQAGTPNRFRLILNDFPFFRELCREFEAQQKLKLENRERSLRSRSLPVAKHRNRKG